MAVGGGRAAPMMKGLSVPSAAGTIETRQVTRRTEVSAELIDALTDAILVGRSDCERAAVVQTLVGHMIEAVAWWHGSSPDEGELESLSRLGQTAADHLQLMLERS